jgi:SAM-dependent methyltransferase
MVGGWAIHGHSNASLEIRVEVNGQLRAATNTGLRRQDVRDAFPDSPGALWSGFATEVFADDLDGQRADVAVKAVRDTEEIPMDHIRTRIKGLTRLVPPRQRDWRFADILACPACLKPLDETQLSFHCSLCERQYRKRRGIPVFAGAGDDEGDPITSRLLETNPTNPNAEDHTRIIESNNLVLDLGAGNPRESEHHPSVVFHEFVHYAHTDVVSVCERLPYREGVFDAVISKATFEHLRRPWEMADEIYRVLKPGGLVSVDTAFMQPLHGDPYHFFNMTLEGAKEIFKRFKLLRCGVKPYQNPSWGLRMQIGVMLEHLQSEDWARRFKALRDSLGDDFDNALDAKGRERLAAGVFLEGVKPAGSS